MSQKFPQVEILNQNMSEQQTSINTSVLIDFKYLPGPVSGCILQILQKRIKPHMPITKDTYHILQLKPPHHPLSSQDPLQPSFSQLKILKPNHTSTSFILHSPFSIKIHFPTLSLPTISFFLPTDPPSLPSHPFTCSLSAANASTHPGPSP